MLNYLELNNFHAEKAEIEKLPILRTKVDYTK